MHVLDGSSQAIVSKGARVGVPLPTLYRHLPILRRCLGSRDRALVVANCARSERPRGRRGLDNLMLLTPSRLVVTGETRLLRRLYLHLNVNLNQLADVAWTAEPEWGGVQLSATAVDGAREHLWIRLDCADRVWRLDALLREAFTIPARAARGARVDQPRPAADRRRAADRPVPPAVTWVAA